MRLAFCLFRYFPFGGIQRDFMRIAEACAGLGHELHLFTLRWDGPAAPVPLQTHLVRVTARRNHRRYEQFATAVRHSLRGGAFDLVIGFNKMPHLDVYFCGDPCFMHEAHSRRTALYRLGGRYRHFSRFEHAVFAPEANVEILLLAEVERQRYQRWFGTPDERFHPLPPSVSPDRLDPLPRHEARRRVMAELRVPDDDRLLLMVGSGFRTKGVDRAIRALAALPNDLRRTTHVIVVGRGRAWSYRVLAASLGVGGRVRFLQGRDDIPTLMAAADVQLHVARKETAGVAIIEGLAAGLPLIVTGECGYAHHVARAGGGFVLSEPFMQDELNITLRTMLCASADELDAWRKAGQQYAQKVDFTRGAAAAAEHIDAFAAQRSSSSSMKPPTERATP